MSDMTLCNYCNLKAIRARNKGKGMVVRVTGEGPDFKELGGINVIVYPKNLRIPSRKQIEERAKFFEDHFVAWFMELTGYCCC